MSADLSLDSLYVGGQPLITPYLERLRVREFLSEAFGPPDSRAKLAPVDTAILLLRNIILSRHPLYCATTIALVHRRQRHLCIQRSE